MRGLYRYNTGGDRWWACVEDDDGQRVNNVRRRYDEMKLQPPFEQLPIEESGESKKERA